MNTAPGRATALDRGHFFSKVKEVKEHNEKVAKSKERDFGNKVEAVAKHYHSACYGKLSVSMARPITEEELNDLKKMDINDFLCVPSSLRGNSEQGTDKNEGQG